MSVEAGTFEPDLRSRRWIDSTVVDIAVVVLTLAGTNLVANFAPTAVAIAAVPAGAALVLIYARARGVRWAELGFSRSHLSRGAKHGLIAGGVTVTAVTALALLPIAQPAFLNERYGVNVGATLLAVFVLIPLQTVIPEEIAFRGVLHAKMARRFDVKWVTIGSSTLFGLWHIATATGLSAGNVGFGRVVGTGLAGQIAGVAVAVVTTTAAGFVFSWLRHRGGSILAPIGLHWAINGAGALAAVAVWHVTMS